MVKRFPHNKYQTFPRSCVGTQWSIQIKDLNLALLIEKQYQNFIESQKKIVSSEF